MRLSVGHLLLVLFALVFVSLSTTCLGQSRRVKPKEELPTMATSEKPAKDPTKQGPKKPPRVRYLIRKNPKGTMAGDRCALGVTRKLGFEYMVMPKGFPGYRNGWDRFTHNFGVKMHLLFTKGPFWKIALKSRLKKCRIHAGELR